jgi:hypothetical protein
MTSPLRPTLVFATGLHRWVRGNPPAGNVEPSVSWGSFDLPRDFRGSHPDPWRGRTEGVKTRLWVGCLCRRAVRRR